MLQEESLSSLSDGIFFPTAAELGDCDIKRVLSNLGYLIMLLAFKVTISNR